MIAQNLTYVEVSGQAEEMGSVIAPFREETPSGKTPP